MVANPHTANSNLLLDKLDNRTVVMPNYMKAQVLEARETQTLKNELESKLSRLKLKQARAFNGLVREYLSDTVNLGLSDSLLTLFQALDNKNIKYRLALYHLQRGEYNMGSIVINTIPIEFDLSTEELDAYVQMVEYFDLVKGIKLDERTFLEANEGEIVELNEIEQSRKGLASMYAKNVLIALDKIEYIAPVQMADLFKSKQDQKDYLELLNTEPPSMISVFPNPSKNYMIIEYHIELEKNGIIEILDVNGIIVKLIKINKLENQVTVNTQDWKPGLYIATLIIEGMSIESYKFTLIK